MVLKINLNGFIDMIGLDRLSIWILKNPAVI
jgi:hypothetical protein